VCSFGVNEETTRDFSLNRDPWRVDTFLCSSREPTKHTSGRGKLKRVYRLMRGHNLAVTKAQGENKRNVIKCSWCSLLREVRVCCNEREATILALSARINTIFFRICIFYVTYFYRIRLRRFVLFGNCLRFWNWPNAISISDLTRINLYAIHTHPMWMSVMHTSISMTLKYTGSEKALYRYLFIRVLSTRLIYRGALTVARQKNIIKRWSFSMKA